MEIKVDDLKTKADIVEIKKEAEEIDKLRKPNALIKGIYGSDVSFNAHDYKVINFLLLILQEALDQLKQDNPAATPTAYTRVKFDLDFYRELVDNSQNWKQKLFNSLLKFNHTFINLQNYIDNFGEKWDLKRVQIIYDPGFIDTKRQNKNQKCSVTFGEIITYPVFAKKAYTHFEYKKLKLLKNQYAMRFYEYLRYKLQEIINSKTNTEDENIVLSKKDFKFVFGQKNTKIIDEKGLATVLDNYINFGTHVVPNMKKLINFDYEINYAEKSIIFKFKSQDLKQFRTVFPTELDVAAEKFKTLSTTKMTYEDVSLREYELSRNFETDENANLQRFVEALTFIYKDKLILDLNETSKFGGDNFRIFSNTFFSEKTKRPLTLSKQKKLLLYLFLNKYSIIKLKAKEMGIWKAAEGDQIFDCFEGRLFKEEFLDMEKIISVSPSENGFSVTYKVRNRDEYKAGVVASLEILEDMLKPKSRPEPTLFDFEEEKDDYEPTDYTGDDYQMNEKEPFSF